MTKKTVVCERHQEKKETTTVLWHSAWWKCSMPVAPIGLNPSLRLVSAYGNEERWCFINIKEKIGWLLCCVAMLHPNIEYLLR